ncbi:MAG: DUF929 family protein [Candidatus Micrarchaeia archaeon]
MAKKLNSQNTNKSNIKTLNYITLAISLIALAFAAFSYTHSSTKIIYENQTKLVYVNSSTSLSNINVTKFNITSSTITPPLFLQSNPIINQSGSFGDRLTNINKPLNATELSIINNAPNSYFETAGEMLINNNIVNTVSAKANKVPIFMLNRKPSVIYLGSITCIFCGENRWAMALALSRFGNFSSLFEGYSSLGDGDIPTLYWAPAHYSNYTVDLGSFYTSKYINFLPIEDTGPITGGFAVQPIATMQQEINSTGNLAYIDAFKLIVQLNNFQGTPYTIWGSDQISGADAIDFGNTPPTSSTDLPLQNMTHAQVLRQLANFNDQFAQSEYAAADLYVAMICGAINNTAPVCSLPAISQIEKQNNY